MVSPHLHFAGMQPHCPVCLHSGFLLQSPGWVMVLQLQGEPSDGPPCRMDVTFDVTLNSTCSQALFRGQRAQNSRFFSNPASCVGNLDERWAGGSDADGRTGT